MEVEPDADHGAVLAAARRDRAVLAVVFLLLFAFSYSEDFVFAALEATGHEHVLGWIIGLVGFDVAVLTVVGLLKAVIARADGDAPRLWRWWWISFAVVVCLDVMLCLLPEEHSLWIDLMSSVSLAILMGVLIAVSLNGDPLTLFSSVRRSAAPRDWARVRAVVPLVIGTFACYIAATSFDDFFDLDTVRILDPEMAAEVAAMPFAEKVGALATLCEGAVSPGSSSKPSRRFRFCCSRSGWSSTSFGARWPNPLSGLPPRRPSPCCRWVCCWRCPRNRGPTRAAVGCSAIGTST